MSLVDEGLPPRFSRAEDTFSRAAVEGQLAALAERVLACAPRAALLLGGSLAEGEALLWREGWRLCALSDLDAFVLLPGREALAPWRLAKLYQADWPYALPLDLNVLFAPLVRLGAQRLQGRYVIAGDASLAWQLARVSRPAERAATAEFVLRSLASCAEALLRWRPAAVDNASPRAYVHGVARAAAGLLRCEANLIALEQGSPPQHALTSCLAQVKADPTIPEPTLTLYRLAVRSTVELGLRERDDGATSRGELEQLGVFTLWRAAREALARLWARRAPLRWLPTTMELKLRLTRGNPRDWRVPARASLEAPRLVLEALDERGGLGADAERALAGQLTQLGLSVGLCRGIEGYLSLLEALRPHNPLRSG